MSRRSPDGYGPISMPAGTKNRLAGAAYTLELQCNGGPACEYVNVPQKVEVALTAEETCIH